MWCLCVLSASGVGAIVFLHAFPLSDIQCYWYRLRHPHPDKVIWNHCWIRSTNEYLLSRYMRELSYSAYTGLNNTMDLVRFNTNWIRSESWSFYSKPIFIFSVTSWNVIITFSVISFLLLRASFQTGANDNSSELMGKNENNFAEPCDRDYYGKN